MRFDVLVLSLAVILPATSAAVAGNRDLDVFQEEHEPCLTFIIEGVKHVDCSDRFLTDLPANLDYTAQVLDVSNNNFANFPAALEKFHHLQILDFSGNRLNEPLPLYMSDWRHLRTLNLSDNNYEIWPASIISSSIKSLDLSKNKINSIEIAAITQMINLSHLNLSENRIYDLPSKMFVNAHNLEELILSRNYFSEMPSFESSSLRYLYLSNCQISTLLAHSFAGMTSILSIDLSINEIDVVSDNLFSNTLQELDLSYNTIGSLTDHTFSSLPHLAVLKLRGNDFREVWPTSYFASNRFLREVHLKGNRWSCEGFNVNLLLTYEYLAPKVSDQGSLICYSPSNVTQYSWQQAYIQTWHSGETVESYTALAVVIGIIIGIILTSFVCRGLMALNRPDPPGRGAETTNLNGLTPQPRAESVQIRIPLREDLPPTYDEALLMPRLGASFHSLPDFVDEEPVEDTRNYRRSRSIGDLTESRTRVGDRRSVRRTVQIHITTQRGDEA